MEPRRQGYLHDCPPLRRADPHGRDGQKKKRYESYGSYGARRISRTSKSQKPFHWISTELRNAAPSFLLTHLLAVPQRVSPRQKESAPLGQDCKAKRVSQGFKPPRKHGEGLKQQGRRILQTAGSRQDLGSVAVPESTARQVRVLIGMTLLDSRRGEDPAVSHSAVSSHKGKPQVGEARR